MKNYHIHQPTTAKTAQLVPRDLGDRVHGQGKSHKLIIFHCAKPCTEIFIVQIIEGTKSKIRLLPSPEFKIYQVQKSDTKPKVI